MCSKQWEMHLMRLKQWEQRTQWELKRQRGMRQEKRSTEVNKTNPSIEAGNTSIHDTHDPLPIPEPEPEDEGVPERAGHFVTRSGRQWGLISTATNNYEAELDDDLGRPGKDEG